MEDGLRLNWSSRKEQGRLVLILVVMEDGLRLSIDGKAAVPCVLILVVMEDGLRREH